jgi:Zn-dependent protease/predicted transcriptional regulator
LSLQVTKIKGIPIRLHFTLIIVFFLIAWTLAARLMPEIYPGLTREEYWIIGILGAGVLFISVLLHELAHSIVALKYGLKVRQIILFIFGGVSDIEEQGESSKDFRKEFKIAVVGPITSFVIAGILALAWWILLILSSSAQTGFTTTDAIKSIVEAVLRYGALTNTLLGVFNLIPAFPLDGGRILRSALVRWKKNYDQSTKIAVRIGIAISYGFIAFGFITMFSVSFVSGMWIMFIGWFLNSGAQSYLSQHELSTTLSGVRLRDIMNTRFISVKPDITVNDLLNNYFNVYRKSEFPVVDEKHGSNLLGAVTAKQAINVVPEHDRDRIRVEEIMIPKSKLIVMKSNRTADEALRRIFRENKSRVFVYDDEEEEDHIEKRGGGLIGEKEEEKLEVKEQERQRQKLVGLISKTDLLNIAREREEYEKEVKRVSSSNIEERRTSFSSSFLLSTHKFNIVSRQRLLFLIFGMILFIIAYSVGAILVKINSTEAEIMKKHFQEQIKGINQYKIFVNNFRVALGMFIPGFGIALGIFSAFSTGLVFNAISHTSPIIPHISPLIVFLTPFGILEIIAYGIAISRSGIISYQLIKDTNKRKSWQKYVIPTIIEIVVVLVILLIGAIIEWQMAQQFGILGKYNSRSNIDIRGF